MKVAIVTDSTAYIPKQQLQELQIEMIPLNVIFGTASYQEEVELFANEFYQKLKTESELPKTSQPAIGLFVECFERLATDYDAVISIHLSAEISGTYQAAVAASDMVDNIKVYPYDSEITAYMQGFYVLEAAELAKQGKTAEEILKRLVEMKQTMDAFFVVEDLAHLKRGGRLTGAQALFGSMLQIKPLLRFDKKIIPYEKIRTRKKATKKMLEIFSEEIKNAKKIKAVVIEGNCLDDAREIKQQIEAEHQNVEVKISHLGPVLATHLGEGTIGLGWYVNQGMNQ